MPMLDFRQDRLDYGRMLIPPEGYRLDRAVAATYSIDLNTLLSIPVALFYSQTLEGKLTCERLQVLEAIRRTSEVVSVYCQERQVHVPDRYNRLFAFMEDMIVHVRPADAFTSFHPKVWVIRYVQDGHEDRVTYRVLVLTRNLTYDRSWDLAVTLEGQTGNYKREVNAPLVDFLTHLNGIRPLPEFRRFSQDLAKTRLVPPAGFDRLTFHPLGIPGYRASPIAATSAIETLCMSPFLDASIIMDLGKKTEGKLWLFGRRQELAKLPSEVVKGCKAYCLSDLVVEGEAMAGADEGTDDYMEQDLHAKLFLFRQMDKCRWFVGSANATEAGQVRNAEFAVELIGSHRSAELDGAIKDLLGGDNHQNIFEEFAAEMAGQIDTEVERRTAVRRLEYQLVQVPLIGTLKRSENAINYDLTVTVDLTGLVVPKGISLAAKPLNCSVFVPLESGKVNPLLFENIRETDLSRFMAFSIVADGETLRRFVVRYELDGMPPGRLDSIFKSIVSNRDKFFEYLRFLLTDEVSKGDITNDPTGSKSKGHGEDDDFFLHGELPIFERLIVAASRDPMKLKAVDKVIERLRSTDGEEEAPIPPEFLDFWEVFRPFVPLDYGGRGSNGR